MGRKANKLPPMKYLKECFEYDPKSGILYWRHRPLNHFATLNAYSRCNSQHAGNPAGQLTKPGYLRVLLRAYGYFPVHRIVWKLVYGSDPGDLEVDHKNLDKSDNRIKNLRLATSGQNQRNHAVHSDSKSGIKGVSWHKASNRWRAQLRVKGRIINLGGFKDIDRAERVVRAARKKYHGTFANHG